MESKVFGIPLVVWVFLVGLGVFIGLPMWAAHKLEMNELARIEREVIKGNAQPVVSAPVSITPSPSVTLVPKASSIHSSSPSGKVVMPSIK